jgi:WhiB family redox-sensing transcriptional regulator
VGITTTIHGHSIWAVELTPSIILEAQPWRQDAACRDVDVEVFFPNSGTGSRYDVARAICSTCPVLADCRRWADRAEGSGALFGMVAGESPRERAARRRGGDG